MNPRSQMSQLLWEVTLAEILDNRYIMLTFLLMVKFLAFFFLILKIKQYAFEKDFFEGPCSPLFRDAESKICAGCQHAC